MGTFKDGVNRKMNTDLLVKQPEIRDFQIEKKAGRKFLSGLFSPPSDKDRLLLALCAGENNLASLLECVFTAHLVKTRHGMRTEILVHEDTAELALASGVFDRVLPIDADASLRSQIQTRNPYVLYAPDPALNTQMASLFSGVRLRIGGTRLRLINMLMQLHDREADLAKLKKKGLDLLPEKSNLQFSGQLARPDFLPDDYIYLSLFDELEITAPWPTGHAGRLVRLLEGIGIKVVIPHPARNQKPAEMKSMLEYLKKAGAITFEYSSPTIRASVMQNAKSIIGPAGPETLLASLLGRPVFILHDMKSFHDVHEQKNSQIKSSTKISMYLKAAGAMEKHFMPAVEECITDCDACSFHCCVEYISPERVFESSTKPLYPF